MSGSRRPRPRSFGPVVNLASRAVDDYRFTPIGPAELKGFDDPVELFDLS